MASFAAELHVAGQSFPVIRCTFGVEQATLQRGRVSAKVRYKPVQLLLDVPEDDTLLAWAAAPHKRQAATILIRNAAGGSVSETLHLQAAYCVSYEEEFVAGSEAAGAYVCHLTLSDPEGWTLTAGGLAGAFVAPAAREHGVPGAAGMAAAPAVLQQIGGKRKRVDADPHAAAWAAARQQVLGTARVDSLYAAYQARKKGKGRAQDAWWNGNNNRGGAKRTVEGGLGEYQADQLFAAQGHGKLNHGGQLVGLQEPPKGKGLDGVWKNAAPPPEYLITETKYDSAKLSKGQMSDDWVKKNLAKSVGEEEGLRIERAMDKGQVGKRLLHIDKDGELREYQLDEQGKILTLANL